MKSVAWVLSLAFALGPLPASAAAPGASSSAAAPAPGPDRPGALSATALLSALVGALIGSLTSIGTLVVQNVFQNRRESKRLLFETAFKDYELRITHLPENRAAFPVILAYHQKMIELTERGGLTPAAAKDILRMQTEMGAALQQAVEDLEAAPRRQHQPKV